MWERLVRAVCFLFNTGMSIRFFFTELCWLIVICIVRILYALGHMLALTLAFQALWSLVPTSPSPPPPGLVPSPCPSCKGFNLQVLFFAGL